MNKMMVKGYVKANNIMSERGASEMVAVVVLVVLVIAISLVALPGVRGTLINSFNNITTGINSVGSTAGY